MTTEESGRKNLKDVRYDLLPPGPLHDLALHYGINSIEHGGKYPARNWEKGYPWSASYAALMRHAVAFWAGEEYDDHTNECPENCTEHSGMPHLTAVAWHAFALREFMQTKNEFDDRPLASKRLALHLAGLNSIVRRRTP